MNDLLSHIIALYLLLLLPLCMPGQQANLRPITIEDGLSQGMVYDLLQDREGFMWIATKDGLNRYDGYDFQHFSPLPSESFSISGDIVTCLYEDAYGRIWAGTENHGLNIFHPATERFYKLGFQAEGGRGLSSNRILSVLQQNDTTFWLGTGNGVERLRVPPGDMLWQKAEEARLESAVTAKYYPLGEGGEYFGKSLQLWNGRLLVGSLHTIFEMSADDPQGFSDMRERYSLPVFNRLQYFTELFLLKNGALIAMNSEGYLLFQEGSVRFFTFPEHLFGPWSSCFRDAEGRIWGAAGSCFFRFYPGRKGAEAFELLYRFPKSHFHSAATIDRNGLIWLGTNGYGVRIYDPRQPLFHHQLDGLSLRRLLIDSKGRCWAWHNRQLHWVDLQTGEYTRPIGFPDRAVRSNWVVEAADGTFWFRFPVVEEGNALIHYDPDTGDYAEYPFEGGADAHCPMAIDGDGRVWLPLSNGKLAIWEDGNLHYHEMAALFPEAYRLVSLNALYYEPENGEMWAGSPYGLLRLRLEKAGVLSARVYRYEEGRPGGPVSNHILSITGSKDDFLWLGTRGGGFSRFDPQTGWFDNYTTADGLPNNVVYGILRDDSGNLWMSTNRGLSRFNPAEEHFLNFTEADGLQASEFNGSSYARAPDGRLLFGGINGLNSFYPEDLKIESQPSPVCITKVLVNNEPYESKGLVQEGRPLRQELDLKLHYSENLLNLRYAALHYGDPPNNQYRYRLLGLSEDTVSAGSRREVAFAYLPPGAYTFQVWGKSKDGLWPEEPAELSFWILPPWWATVWAFLLYALLLGAAVYSLYRFQVGRAKLQNQLAYEQREAERLAELDRLKSGFFSNITHEFRTPLTLILEPARQLLKKQSDEEVQDKAYLIKEHAQRLLQLVNQLLYVSKVESGMMPVEYRAANLRTLLGNWLKQYEGLAHSRGLELEDGFSGSLPDRAYPLDVDKLKKIISNLLSNACKFTPPGGKVVLQARVEKDGDFRVAVKDTGVGIAEEEQQQIFERFYQVDGSSTRRAEGTGIGLALSRDLARLLGGSLTVDSRPGQGAVFTLRVPVQSVAGNPAAPFSAQPSGRPLSPAKAAASRQSVQLLIVEDNERMRSFIRQSVGEEYTVLEAADGLQGLRMAMEHTPDLVVSDVMMPNLDGLELTQRLKEDERTSHIPVILLTAKSAVEARLRGLEAGADAYLAKPFHTEELSARIRQLIDLRKKLQRKYSSPIAGQANTTELMPPREEQFLTRLQSVFEERLDDPELNVETLAEAMHLSRSQLHRKLKALTGASASAYLRDYRLQRAHELLQQKGSTVGEVSLQVGFNSPQYFATRFKDKFGYSPSEING